MVVQGSIALKQLKLMSIATLQKVEILLEIGHFSLNTTIFAGANLQEAHRCLYFRTRARFDLYQKEEESALGALNEEMLLLREIRDSRKHNSQNNFFLA